MDPRHVTIPWVNDGKPFLVSKDTITSEDHRQGLFAKMAALAEAGARIPKDAAPGILTPMQMAARQLAAAAQFQAILFRLARRVDPRLKAKSDDEMRDLLKETEFDAFMDAASPPPPEKGNGKEPGEAARPLLPAASSAA